MAYKEALEAAGAVVIDYRELYTWQGDWFAIIKYNGQIGVIKGLIGSCEGCDAFLQEFQYVYEDESNYQTKLEKFGKSYLYHIMTVEEALTETGNNSYWDLHNKELEDWIKILKGIQFSNKLEEIIK